MWNLVQSKILMEKLFIYILYPKKKNKIKCTKWKRIIYLILYKEDLKRFLGEILHILFIIHNTAIFL